VSKTLIALLGVIIGVLLGGGMQIFFAWWERRQAGRRAARLLFGDHYLALSAIRSMAALGVWWNEMAAPPVSDWKQYREALAGRLGSHDFQTVDGAFHRAANLETWRRAGLDALDMTDQANEAAEQMTEAGGILLVTGFSGRELQAAEKEMNEAHANPWANDDDAAEP
jgi:hypothetical protein